MYEMTNLMTFRPLLAFSGPLLCTVKIKRIINLIKRISMKMKLMALAVLFLLSSQMGWAQTAAFRFTKEKNNRVEEYLFFDNEDDFRDVGRSLLLQSTNLRF